MHFARDVADQLLFFDGGRILQQGAPRDVLDHPGSDRLKAFLRRFSEANYL
jgi:polar amino acid transport system ATP-binding protein